MGPKPVTVDQDIIKLDLYELLGIEITANNEQIRKAYRKTALSCHPDKNPDNPKAAETFHQLSKAFEILCTDETRKIYDNALKARKAAIVRQSKLDKERRRMRDELEEREQRAAEQAAESALLRRVQQLQREGSVLLRQEQDALRRQVVEENSRISVGTSGVFNTDSGNTSKLKLKWDHSKHPYSDDLLRRICSEYGTVSDVLMLVSKPGTALIEFSAFYDLSNIKSVLNMDDFDLTGKWVSKPTCASRGETNTAAKSHATAAKGHATAAKSHVTAVPLSTAAGLLDREASILERMKAAQATKRTQPTGNDDDRESAILKKLKAAQSMKDRASAAAANPIVLE